jgi:hypothetical protein
MRTALTNAIDTLIHSDVRANGHFLNLGVILVTAGSTITVEWQIVTAIVKCERSTGGSYKHLDRGHGTTSSVRKFVCSALHAAKILTDVRICEKRVRK